MGEVKRDHPTSRIAPAGGIGRVMACACALALSAACGGNDAASARAPADQAKTAAAAPEGPVPARATAPPVPAPVDLSKLNSNIPAARSDTFAFRPLQVERIPDAPPALMDAAEREQGISRFCYQEYGQKRDPMLIGSVALVVTVDNNIITAVRIGVDDWSSTAGRAVNRCLTEKALEAWKLLPDAKVTPGRYVIQLQFRPS